MCVYEWGVCSYHIIQTEARGQHGRVGTPLLKGLVFIHSFRFPTFAQKAKMSFGSMG